MNNVILLHQRPVGKPTLNNFKFVQEAMPVPQPDELLLRTRYISVDPYLRGRMSEAKSYAPSYELNAPMQSGVVSEVMESHHDKFKKGDFVLGMLSWKEYQVSSGKGLMKVNPNDFSLSAYLGILGMTGLTAYFGLLKIGVPKSGETIVVSGAAGAVGTVVGQIGKLMGCRVVGIAGTDEKTSLLKSKFNFDEAINYRTTVDMNQAIKAACPNGVDVYFDNVGGEISDAVLTNINQFARIVICGVIAQYNDATPSLGPRIQRDILINSALMRGFIITEFQNQFPEGMMALAGWLKEGKLAYSETIREGFNNVPQAFLDLFDGKNEGKMIVKI